MSATNSRIKAIVAIAAAALFSSGCGGGAGSVAVLIAEGVGSGGTGLGVVQGIGVLTGFGSLIVDGVRRDDSMATYMSEEDHAMATAIAPTGARLGQRLEYAYGPDGAMTSALFSPELVGTVTAVSASGITVLGTTVMVNPDPGSGPVTSLIGYPSPASIQVGDRVAVYGLIGADAQGANSLQATLIVRKSAGSGIRLTGYVRQLNTTTGILTIGTNTIAIGSAVITPAGASLRDNQLVTVWSNTPPTGDVISAASIRIKWPPQESGDRALSGLVSAYSDAANFKVLNVTVDASSATIEPKGAAVGDGRYVTVVGRFDAATGKLTATTVTVYSPAAGRAVELHGTVLNFVSPSSFTVRGVVVDASTATYSGGTAADLGNNVFVEVTGAVKNNVVLANTVTLQKVDLMHLPMNSVLDVEGTIESYDPRTGAYTLRLQSGQSISGNINAAAFYEEGAAADFAVGKSVTLRSTIGYGSMMTSVVRFSPPGAGSSTSGPADGMPAHLEGVVYNVTDSSFMVNGITVQINGVSVQGAGMMGLRQGQHVRVDVVSSGGKFLATAIRMGSS